MIFVNTEGCLTNKQQSSDVQILRRLGKHCLTQTLLHALSGED